MNHKWSCLITFGIFRAGEQPSSTLWCLVRSGNFPFCSRQWFPPGTIQLSSPRPDPRTEVAIAERAPDSLAFGQSPLSQGRRFGIDVVRRVKFVACPLNQVNRTLWISSDQRTIRLALDKFGSSRFRKHFWWVLCVALLDSYEWTNCWNLPDGWDFDWGTNQICIGISSWIGDIGSFSSLQTLPFSSILRIFGHSLFAIH
jgi:hypothetical protein